MDEGEHEQAVGAGPDPDPFVRDGVVAGAARIDRDHLDAARLELAETDLDRIGIVVLRHPEQHEVFGELPIGLAELPERSADGMEAGSRHVDGAEAAMRREIGRAELPRPPAGQRLRLVAAGEEGEPLGIGRADVPQPLRRQSQRLVPFDLAEFARAARSRAQQGLAQAGRAQVLHDAGAALAADDPAVDRVVAVAGDVTDLAILDVDVDAAAAGAHVAGGAVNRVGDDGRGFHAIGFRGRAGVGEGTLGRCRVGGRTCGHDVGELPPPASPESWRPEVLRQERLRQSFWAQGRAYSAFRAGSGPVRPIGANAPSAAATAAAKK